MRMRRIARSGSLFSKFGTSDICVLPTTSEEVPEKLVLTLEFGNMIGKHPCHAIGSPLRPTRLQIANMISQTLLECSWKFRTELFEERSQVGLQPVKRLFGTTDKKQ